MVTRECPVYVRPSASVHSSATAGLVEEEKSTRTPLHPIEAVAGGGGEGYEASIPTERVSPLTSIRSACADRAAGKCGAWVMLAMACREDFARV